MDASHWTDPAWRAEADAWIREQVGRLELGRITALDQRHVYPWSTVMRVLAGTGDLWFKANAPELRQEAALVARLAQRRPDCVPPLLAADLDRGWMLMADAGTRLRELIQADRTLTRWLDVLRLYAGVQVDMAPEAGTLVALGVPDLRLATLPDGYEQLLGTLAGLPADERRRLDERRPWVREACRELASYGIPETIQHDDLHDAQVYLRDGRYRFLDWGDACVSHPFFTLSVTLEGVISWGLDDVQHSVDVAPFRDAYLEPFRALAPDADLEAAATIATRLGWVCRAVNGDPSSDPDASRTRLRMFLDGHPQGARSHRRVSGANEPD